MTKKTNIILAIGTFSMLFLSIIGYFGINYIIDKNFQENTIQCSNDTEKRKESFSDKNIGVYENFYSKKLKTCLILWYDEDKRNWVTLNVSLIIKELYTWRSLDSFKICNTSTDCKILSDYLHDGISELIWIEKEAIKNICSSENADNQLNKYCSLTKYWDSQEKWKLAVDSYR